jgi:SAM-dependent methyltransferase
VKDRLIRKLIPSAPVFAKIKGVGAILDFVDDIIKRKHPEWSHLPPASLRLRIGVGNKILRNHSRFIESGDSIVSELMSKGYLSENSDVLELGCGCGRNAISLLQFLEGSGSYIGQDVDAEMISWCSNNLHRKNFQFYFADIYSKVYNPAGKPVDSYEFPAELNSRSLIFAVSLFSHLLYKDFYYYINQCSRVLKIGGYLHMTLFIHDFVKARLNNRWTFSNKLDNCYVENLNFPEAAVAYDLAEVEKILSVHNLSIVDIYNKDIHQQTLIAKKSE